MHIASYFVNFIVMPINTDSVTFRSSCPIASCLDIVGDKWTLLVIRDIALFDKHRNKEFERSLEGFPTNLLADRLKKLVAWGLIEKMEYQNNPPRYEYYLTEKGEDLVPVLETMAQWSARHIEGVKMPGLNTAG